MSNFPKCKLEEIALAQKGAFAMGPFGSNIKKENYQDYGVPVIRGFNLNTERFDNSNFVYLSEEKARELKSSSARPNDIVFTAQGTIGQVGIIPSNIEYKEFILSQNLMKVTVDSTIADPLFVFYYFRSTLGQNEIRSYANTTGVPSISRPLSSLKNFHVPLPSLYEQQRIAEILGALDDKIELNRRMNRTLEAMARALFQSWFVDFDPVHAKARGETPYGMDEATAALFPDSFEETAVGRVPMGWGVEPIGRHTNIIRGLSYKGEGLSDEGTPLHSLNCINEGGGYKFDGIKYYQSEYKSSHVVVPGDLIVANTEQGFNLLLIASPALIPRRYGNFGIISHHIYKLEPKPNSPFTRIYLYFLLRSARFRRTVQGFTNGTTVNALPQDGLERPLMVVPLRDTIKQFDSIIQPMLAQQELNDEENNSLEALRNTLLPQLLSGKLSPSLDLTL